MTDWITQSTTDEQSSLAVEWSSKVPPITSANTLHFVHSHSHAQAAILKWCRMKWRQQQQQRQTNSEMKYLGSLFRFSSEIRIYVCFSSSLHILKNRLVWSGPERTTFLVCQFESKVHILLAFLRFILLFHFTFPSQPLHTRCYHTRRRDSTRLELANSMHRICIIV